MWFQEGGFYHILIFYINMFNIMLYGKSPYKQYDYERADCIVLWAKNHKSVSLVNEAKKKKSLFLKQF